MKLTKKQKMLLGVGALAVVGYMLWKKQTSFTGAVGRRQKNATGSGIKKVVRSGNEITIYANSPSDTSSKLSNAIPCKDAIPAYKCQEGNALGKSCTNISVLLGQNTAGCYCMGSAQWQQGSGWVEKWYGCYNQGGGIASDSTAIKTAKK